MSPPSSKLSEQQQRRITDNFRAAKAILARKRPHLSASSPSSPSPLPHWTTENKTPTKAYHGGRSPSPAKRMCTPTLPDKGERIPLGELSGNHYVPNNPVRPWGACEPPRGSIYSKGTNKVEAQCVEFLSSSSMKMQASSHPSLVADPPREQQIRGGESQFLLPEDICEDFDEELLRELDDLCEKQAKTPAKTTKESIDFHRSVALQTGGTGSDFDELLAKMPVNTAKEFINFHRPVGLQTGVTGSEFHNLAAPEQPAKFQCTDIPQFANVASRRPTLEHLTSANAGLERDAMTARRSSLGELLVLADRALISSEDTQCLNLGFSTSTDVIPPAIPVLEPRPAGVDSGSSDLSVTQPLTAPASNEAACDTELHEYLRKLNETQREAALSDTSKPLLILAGPGSGKTSTMVARLVTLLREGVEAKNILAMTFTTAAATEMRQRVGAATGKTVSKELSISTFHSFCLQLCRAHADKLGRSAEFLVYGHGQQRRAVIEATRLATLETQTGQGGSAVNDSSATTDTELNTSGKENSTGLAMWKDKAKKWQQFVTQAKAAGRTSLDYEKMGNIVGAAVLRHYEATLAACDALDYHDFISFAVCLLENNPEVLDECQKTWRCVLVDEFQDTSTMQYQFLRLLASHNRVTIVGDDDQSIFSFNGANASGFDSFRQDFPQLKEVRLHQNYRSTGCIVEAATSLIRYNKQRCQEKQAHTDNADGDKIVVMECRTEAAECSFVVDSILMNYHGEGSAMPAYGNIAVLYRRQVTGRMFQAAFRSRKIPFNVHGVAFYRKKIIKNVTSVLWTVLPGNADIYWRRVLKALYSGDKSESKRVVEYVDKVAKGSKCSFHQAAQTIFTAKVSGTFSRQQLALGRRVLTSIEMVCRLAHKERSLSGLITAVINLLPQRPVFDSRAIVDEDGGKLLNEDDDPRTVLEYFLDDVNDFLSNFFNSSHDAGDDESAVVCGQVPKVADGCLPVLKAFLDHLVSREADNFQQRRKENKNSVTLTTMHQSKGLEWDNVYIIKANDTETPLLNEGRGQVGDGACSLEEERRLFYVAMTRARKKLFICYVVVDSQRQVLQPSRFLKELPRHLLNFKGDSKQERGNAPIPERGVSMGPPPSFPDEAAKRNLSPKKVTSNTLTENVVISDIDSEVDLNDIHNQFDVEENVISKTRTGNTRGANEQERDAPEGHDYGAVASTFLKGFNMEARSTIAALFNSWARKPAFQDPKRLLSKVGFVVDERLRSKNTKNKDVLIALKFCLRDEAALAFALNAIKWGQLPAEERALLQAERQEHFQQLSSERSMGAAAATPKQIAFLRSLGCTVDPTSRLHASKLIEQYRKL